MNKLLIAICAVWIGSTGLWASSEGSLRTVYTRMMEDLESDLMRQIPLISEVSKFAYQDASKNESAAGERLQAEEARMAEIKSAKGLVDHANNHWIKKAEGGIAKAKADMEKAENSEARAKAKQELANWEKNKEDGLAALKERTAKWEALKQDESAIQRAVGKAKADLEAAKQEVVQAIHGLGINGFLANDQFDASLARFLALKEATPAALAKYAAQSRQHEAQVEAFLKNDRLLLQIAVADGPAKAERAPNPDYPRMIEIYHKIQAASDMASEGVLQRLALAVALVHANPVAQRNAEADVGAPEYVDPLQRYLHFEKAYLAGELDPHFKQLTVWDLRMVVDGEEPEAILSWGREMLRNYRPDHITTSDHRWRYVGLVRTDVPYGSQDNQYDQDDLQFFQNILKNGGICGRRAFFGRFILRAFGNPTTARPQRGHGALVRWTPNGWVPVLGAGWGSGWTKTPYDRDLDFLATTQARALGEHFLKVKRAFWVGDLLDEPRSWGLLNKKTPPAFWNGVALYTQRALIADKKILAAVGEELSEANESNVVYAIETAEITEADRKVRVDDRGVIHIPAAATTRPKSSQGRIIFTPSVLGGLQLHYQRSGGKLDFEYSIDAPNAGLYELVAKVVTPSWQQNLVLSLNGQDQAAEIPLPHTVGSWAFTKPVQLELKQGRNVLRFSHRADGNDKGFTLKEFQLAPVPIHARR